MLRSPSNVRLLRFLVLTLQLALWGAVPVADALLDLEGARATVHVESHTQQTCPRGHGIDCPLCHFLQLHAAPRDGGSPLPVALSRSLREADLRVEPPAAERILSPLPRAPPQRS